jgi:hypothetical protein
MMDPQIEKALKQIAQGQERPELLFETVKTADPDIVLEIWNALTEIVRDPSHKAKASAGDPDAIGATMLANGLRVHIQQVRPELKSKLPGAFL